MAKISFIMIVKNGMPFIKYSLSTIYPFAHEIIIAYDERSNDGTIDFINYFIENAPYGKITLIKGKWDDKNDQCNACAAIATGNWIWQHDCDEIYHQHELAKAVNFLSTIADKPCYCINIINFFRNLNTVVVDGLFSIPPVRVFAHEPGDLYKSHRPPSLIKKNGKVIKSDKTCIPGISIYHYSHIGINKMREKAEYYATNMKSHPIYKNYLNWFHEVYLDKSRTKNLHITGEGKCHLFGGDHPSIIQKAIERGELNEYV